MAETPTQPEDVLIDLRAAARRLGVSVDSARLLVKKGHLGRPVDVSTADGAKRPTLRIRAADLAAFIDRRTLS